MPTHQGRAAENILTEVLVRPDSVVPSNTLFDTTRAHIEHRHGIGLDMIGDWIWDFESVRPFKGDFDLQKLRIALTRYPTSGSPSSR